MKKKFTIGLFLWAILIVLGTISLTSCSNDDNDDLDSDIYQGYVENLYNPDVIPGPYDYYIIIVSHTPKNKFKGIKNNARLRVFVRDLPEADLKANQKISFRINSANKYDPNAYVIFLGVWESYDWDCKIEILNLD